NFPTYKVLMEEHSASKGVGGYLDGAITKPAVVTAPTGTPLPDPTPVCSTNPSREEFLYRDGVMRSMLVTNIFDPIGLGVKCNGTAKECWNSIVS
ncbi:hypothetical protein B0H13DRAFT_1526177, partial [Mycena leptocephala]